MMAKPISTTPESAGEQTLRGTDLKRNPDTTVRVDGEPDSLYDDGLEVDDDAGSLAETRGADHHT